MRLVARFVLGLLISGCGVPSMAREGGSGWWPFGNSDKSTQSPTPTNGAGQPHGIASAPTMKPAVESGKPALTPPASDLPTSVDRDNGWFTLTKPSWPPIHMPEVSLPSLPRPKLFSSNDEGDATNNRWYQQQQPPAPSAWDTVRGGAQRVRQRTRSAWDKTVDVLTPGDSTESDRIARREPEALPLWKRMLGAEPPEEGPQTVTEWMAQDRLNP